MQFVNDDDGWTVVRKKTKRSEKASSRRGQSAQPGKAAARRGQSAQSGKASARRGQSTFIPENSNHAESEGNKCKIGKIKVEPCCNRMEEGRDCHFHEDYRQMYRDYISL